MIFLKDFYDIDGKVNTKNIWVWYFHFVSYAYIIYEYIRWGHNDRKMLEDGDDYKYQSSELSEMWIPLDILLTINIAFYQYINLYL
jgi:hypothetical protein